MTTIDSAHNYTSRMVALQLLKGKSETASSGDNKSADSTFVTSEAVRAGKAASGAALPPKREQKEVLAFLSFRNFKASSSDVSKELTKVFSDTDLQAQFNDAVKEEMRKAREETHVFIVPDEARHLALVDVILANREKFPPEQFSFDTTFLGSKGPETVSAVIPSTSDMAAKIFEKQVAEKQDDYDAAAAANVAKPDSDGAKLDAMQEAVRTLVLNGQDAVDGGVSDAKSAYAILTQKLYSDGIGDGHETAAQPTEGHDTAAAQKTES